MKTITLGLLTAATLMMATSCNGSQQKSTATQDSAQQTAIVTDTLAASFYGTYEGTLPAADCGGIKTTLTLHEDTTYDLVCQYLDEENETVTTSGVYEMQGGDLVVLITPSSGVKTFYKVLNGEVALTDSLGTPNTGELAELYKLKKRECCAKDSLSAK